ncbi:MAG: ZIP family metal transporter [Spirochaetia bacterium]|nr:ZIP family metal transporter [Spirochaetota bacterium]MCX8096881.1 ZIP family metal transporter [Spirochaetota bacterium]MDW8112998.1 ZIP family metal transporter [Spirochaetia bacterium]
MTPEILKNINPLTLVTLGVLFTWMLNNLGAALSFIFPVINRKVLDFLLGLSGGIMLAASIWSLLIPSVEISNFFNLPGWIVGGTAFILGGVTVKAIDSILPHVHIGSDNVEGIPSNFRRVTLLYLAMTLHHIPEGFAVGVALGAMGLIPEYSGIPVAVGIGIQNIPEGLALAVAMLAYGISKIKSFIYSVLSGFSEVVGGVVGLLFIVSFPQLLPISLGIAAGAMFFVVIEEVIPESQLSGNTDISTIGAMVGFIVMMTLDTIQI